MTAINQVGNALTGSTGSGTFVGANGPTFVTSTVTAPSITFNSTSGIIGTTTNDSAAAGSVGELISSVIASGSAVSLTTGTPADATSIVLTPGDWDVWGNVTFVQSIGNTVVTNIQGWISSTSATTPDWSLLAGQSFGVTGATQGTYPGMAVPSFRFSVATATTLTVYLSGFATFAVSTASICGGIYARRRR